MSAHYKKMHQYMLLPVILLTCGALLITPQWAISKEAALLAVDNGVMQEKGSGRMWQTTRSKKLQSPLEVQQYLNTLNQGKYKDWRLPTKVELHSLITIFDMKENGQEKMPLQGDYWLVDEDGTLRTGAWETGDRCGFDRTFYKGTSGYVRAVRP